MANEETKWKVIEIPSPSPARELDDETSNLLAGLKDNPGFHALMAKLKLRKAFFDTQLHKRQDSLREVDRLQCYSESCDWLEEQVRKEVGIRQRRGDKPRNAYKVEEDAFNQAMSAITVVGND
jgi:hypothetical protein